MWSGVAAAALFQSVLVWVLFVWALPQQGLLAHVIGLVGRMVMLAVMALVWVPVLGTPPAPTLFSLVGVFFLTTLIEPVFLKPNFAKRA